MYEESADISPGLLAAVQAGDQQAARELVEALYPVVIGVVRNHLPRGEREEDLAQEVFMKIFAKLDQFRGDKPLRHWVSRIALFTCYDALRRLRARRVFSFAELNADEADFLARRGDEAAAEPSSGSGSAARELVDKLVATLKPDQQLAIRLLDLEQRSVKEISELTGWSLSKVKVTAMRARRRLGEALATLERGSLPFQPDPRHG
jgi:RNA polymerase sigma factor (sigma-70 family)